MLRGITPKEVGDITLILFYMLSDVDGYVLDVILKILSHSWGNSILFWS